MKSVSKKPNQFINSSVDFKPKYRIDVRWVANGLFEDGRITEKDMNFVTSSRRTKEELDWHPLQFISKFKLRDQQHDDGYLDIEALTDWFAKKTESDIYYIDPLKTDVEEVTSVMAFKFAKMHNILAVKVEMDKVWIATGQPFMDDWLAGLKQILKDKEIKVVVANPIDIRRYTLEFYNLASSVKGAKDQDTKFGNLNNFEQLLQIGEMGSPDANDQHIVKIVDWILQYSFDQRASDIHLEPRREKSFIRFRIDGVLHDVYDLPTPIMQAVTSRIKILGRMDVAEKRKPQDGRLKTQMRTKVEIELRLATMPTAFGEKLVMRIFDPEVLQRTPEQMGLLDEDFDRWKQMVKHPNGIVLVTGPTGSGKTTMLYSTLKKLSTREVNVCTLEDPIEMIEPSFNQMQILDSIDLSFADGVRALMRQDPDIIMIGEIRDLETANMAIQAALTGHLVISTLHTNDAPSAIVRLMDLGVQPYMISATLLGVMAQRLVRTLCPKCKKPVPVDYEAWDYLTAGELSIPDETYKAAGCKDCRKTGFQGRVGIFEIMPMSRKLKEMVADNREIADIRNQAVDEGMNLLRISGAHKVLDGMTTPEEVLRVAPAPTSKSSSSDE